MHRTSQIRLLLILSASGVAGPALATDWLQYGFDQPQSSFNRAEKGYSTSTGNVAAPGFSAGVSLPSASDSTPIYLGNVATASGTKNLLFVIAKNGTLLAID